MKREALETFLIRKQEEELLEVLNYATNDIKQMMNNIYNVAFRFGLNETQTVYLLNEAVRPFKTLILSDLMEV